MAIYSLRMSAVGKTTQKQPFTAAAHLKYITRKSAVTQVLAARMPVVRRQAIAWLRHGERDDRKNARVIDKVMVALPKELTSVQQHALVRAFAEKLTLGRASWFAAFHTKGKDARNPHCHLILRDRDAETGRRVMYLSAGKKEAAQRQGKGQSAPTTLAAIRGLWERYANQALVEAGRTERIDRRTLKDQGQSRRPQVHEGPNIRAMDRRGFRPRSRDRVMRNSPHRRRGRSSTRIVRYAEIDRGRTRVEFNAALRQEARISVTGRDLGNRERGTSDVVQRAASLRTQSTQPSDRVPAGQPAQTASPLPRAADVANSPRPVPRKLTLTERLAEQYRVPMAQPSPDRDRDRGR